MTCVLLCWLAASVGFILGAGWCALLRDRAHDAVTEALPAQRSARLVVGAADAQPPQVVRLRESERRAGLRGSAHPTDQSRKA